MKKQIRFGVFETNSSSTHSLTIVDKIEFEKWENGEMIFDKDNEELFPITELKNEIEEGGWQYKTYKEFMHYGDLETFVNNYKTKSGDEIVAFGEYGYDG